MSKLHLLLATALVASAAVNAISVSQTEANPDLVTRVDGETQQAELMESQLEKRDDEAVELDAQEPSKRFVPFPRPAPGTANWTPVKRYLNFPRPAPGAAKWAPVKRYLNIPRPAPGTAKWTPVKRYLNFPRPAAGTAKWAPVKRYLPLPASRSSKWVPLKRYLNIPRPAPGTANWTPVKRTENVQDEDVVQPLAALD